VVQVERHLLSKCEALNSNSSIAKEQNHLSIVLKMFDNNEHTVFSFVYVLGEERC
jgi:hypothetical protein